MKIIKISSIGFVLCFLVFSLKAQTESGNILIGGDTKLDFSSLNSSWETESDNGDIGKTTHFEISPNIGFFIVRNIALGVEIPIGYSSEEEENGDKYSSTSYTFAPFLKWYIGKGSVKPYFQGQIGPGKAKMKSTTEDGESDDSTVGMLFYNIEGGLGIFLNEKVALNLGLGYSTVSITPKGYNSSEIKNITKGIGLGLGVVVML